MVRKMSIALACAALVAAPQAVVAKSAGYTVRATVPTHCTVRHQFTGYGAAMGDAVSLGEIRELCNAANGYELVVSYTPGSLNGAIIRAGNDQVVLNGSGEAVLSRSDGPRIIERIVTATPGQSGFDADHIEFRINPA